METYRRLILLLIVLFLPSLINAQEGKRNLTSILEELSHSMAVEISYSPNLTNTVYINYPYSRSSSIDDLLSALLSETILTYKKLEEGHYLIYKKAIEATEPVVIVKEPIIVGNPSPVVKLVRDTSFILRPLPPSGLEDKTKLTYTSSLPYLDLPQKPIFLPKYSKIFLKANGLPIFTAALNFGIEFELANRLSLDCAATINGWSCGKTTSLNRFGVHPEFRLWLNEDLKGSFFGANLYTYYYNIGGISYIESLKDHRYQGILFGTGISYGYRYHFSNKWAIEFTAGVGYAHILYNKSTLGNISNNIESGNYNYVGPNKLGLSIVYRVY